MARSRACCSGRLKLRTTAAESWEPESHEGWWDWVSRHTWKRTGKHWTFTPLGGDAPPVILDFFTCFYPEDLLLCFLMLLLDLLFWFLWQLTGLYYGHQGRRWLWISVCLVTLQFSRVAAVAGGGSCCIVQLSPPANMRGILHVCVDRPADGQAPVCDAELEIWGFKQN